MRRRPLSGFGVVLLLLAAASSSHCGGRTGLERAALPSAEDGVLDAGTSPPDGHPSPQDALSITDAAVAPFDAAAVRSGCTSALQPGAPSPLAGYCSTQSNVAPTRVPSNPVGEWGTQLDGNYAPSEMVVDPEGRAYVASCSAPAGEGVECETLVAMGADGSVRWSQSFDTGVGGLYLDPAGTLHAQSGLPRVLYTFDEAGNATSLGTLPANVSYSFVGSDGSLYGSSVDYGGSADDALVKMTPEGAVVWSTPLACNDCIAAMALSPDDGLVATLIQGDGDGGLSGSLVRADTSGRLLWTLPLDGFTAEEIAVALDGSTRIALWQNYMHGTSTTVLVSVSAAGDILWQTDLQQDPEQTGDDPLVVMNDGTTILRSFTHLNAVDANGKVLWSTPLPCTNCAYAAAADPSGGLVVLLDGIEGIDSATGAVLWSGISPPQEEAGTTYFGSTMTLGPPGVVYGSSFGGVVFEARGM